MSDIGRAVGEAVVMTIITAAIGGLLIGGCAVGVAWWVLQ